MAKTAEKKAATDAKKQGPTLAIHPMCAIFSQALEGAAKSAALTKKEYDELREDIKNHGMKTPILVNAKRDTLIDGRNRWYIAHDLGTQAEVLKNAEVFEGKDEEIPAEIISRNIFRRHLSADQRGALMLKLRKPQYEKEAADSKKSAQFGAVKVKSSSPEKDGKSGSFSGKGNGEPIKGSVAEKLAKDVGISEHKAKQLVKADKAGLTDDIIAKKTTARRAASKVGSKKRTPKAPLTLETQVWRAFNTWFTRKWTKQQEREVLGYLRTFIGDILADRVPKVAQAAAK